MTETSNSIERESMEVDVVVVGSGLFSSVWAHVVGMDFSRFYLLLAAVWTLIVVCVHIDLCMVPVIWWLLSSVWTLVVGMDLVALGQ